MTQESANISVFIYCKMFNLGQHAVANAKQTEEKGEDEKDIKADKRMMSDCRVVTDEEDDVETVDASRLL
jgi:hypothetical protein